MSLDIDRADPAYRLGRLFSALEKTQTDALGDGLNRTIRDSFYSSASATPRIIFPRLITLHQHHLAKLEGGRRVNRDRLVQEISPISKLRYPDDPYQVHMSLTSNYDPEELLEVESAFDEFDPGSGFQATAVELWARVGPSVGGKWGFMKRYPLLT